MSAEGRSAAVNRFDIRIVAEKWAGAMSKRRV
jgi:hypothetical protein